MVRDVSTRAVLPGAEDPSSNRLKAGAAVRNAVTFFAALALGCTALFQLREFPDLLGVGPKYEYYRAHKDRYNVLFVGSSRFYHQIIPQQFDATVGDVAGQQVRSFNLGYDGMWPPESYYLVRQILALRPQALRWVFIDLMDVNVNLDERNDSTQRSAYWHDPRHTMLAWRHLWYESRHPRGERLRLSIAHGLLLARQVVNIGAGVRRLQAALTTPKGWKQPKEWAGREGFNPGPDTPMVEPQLTGYQDTVARLRRSLPPNPVGPVLRSGMADLIRDIRQAGAEPVFVIAPTLNARENFTDLPEGAALLAFNDPNRFPVLFEPETHYDGWHLNERGAQSFTELLARRFRTEVLTGSDGAVVQEPACK